LPLGIRYGCRRWVIGDNVRHRSLDLPARPTAGVETRLAEPVAALSLGIDLGFGQPMEHVLRRCMIALRLAEGLGLDEDERLVVNYTALLVNVGCHTDAHEQARWFGDDIAMKSGKYDYEFGSVRAALASLRRLKRRPSDIVYRQPSTTRSGCARKAERRTPEDKRGRLLTRARPASTPSRRFREITPGPAGADLRQPPPPAQTILRPVPDALARRRPPAGVKRSLLDTGEDRRICCEAGTAL
jgi:hypothetical protein